MNVKKIIEEYYEQFMNNKFNKFDKVFKVLKDTNCQYSLKKK